MKTAYFYGYSMVFQLLRFWSTWLFPAFYRRIGVRGIEHIQSDGPTIIAMNHPNAFTDPALFAYLAYPVRLHYLARGDAFKPGFLAWFLSRIGIIPIYRLRDAGKAGLALNDDTYRRVNRLLARKAKVIVFAEGLCIQERRLRPLKKGVARMVFGAYEFLKDPNLKIVPVGVNYEQPDRFRSDVFFNIGEPMAVGEFLAGYANNPARGQKEFLSVLEKRMRELITHIEDPQNDELVHQLETLTKDETVKARGLNPDDLHAHFIVTKEITEKVNRCAPADPVLTEALKFKIRQYLSDLNTARVSHACLNPAFKLNWSHFMLRAIAATMMLAYYVPALIFHYPLMIACAKIPKRLSAHREFFSSFAIVAAMLTFTVWYGLWLVILMAAGLNLWGSLAICALMYISGWMALISHPFMVRTIEMLRLLKRPETRARLEKEREVLMQEINKFYGVCLYPRHAN